MNYTLEDLKGRDLEITKTALIKQHDTLDLVLKPGDEITDQLRNYADSISHLDDKGAVVAVTKHKDGQTYDNRNRRAKMEADKSAAEKPEQVTRLPEDKKGPNNPLPTEQATNAKIPGAELPKDR